MWQKIIVVSVIAVSSIASIVMIGRKREPITPGMAAFIVVFNLIMIGLILSI